MHALVDDVAAAGLPVDRIFLLGFSQGGCLALEAAARRPQRYGGVVGLSAALIENGDQPRRYTGDMAGTPVFLGCSDVDAHIPPGRLERSAEILAALGGAVDKRIYPGLGHTVNADEIEAVRKIVGSMQPTATKSPFFQQGLWLRCHQTYGDERPGKLPRPSNPGFASRLSPMALYWLSTYGR